MQITTECSVIEQEKCAEGLEEQKGSKNQQSALVKGEWKQDTYSTAVRCLRPTGGSHPSVLIHGKKRDTVEQGGKETSVVILSKIMPQLVKLTLQVHRSCSWSKLPSDHVSNVLDGREDYLDLAGPGSRQNDTPASGRGAHMVAEFPGCFVALTRFIHSTLVECANYRYWHPDTLTPLFGAAYQNRYSSLIANRRQSAIYHASCYGRRSRVFGDAHGRHHTGCYDDVSRSARRLHRALVTPQSRLWSAYNLLHNETMFPSGDPPGVDHSLLKGLEITYTQADRSARADAPTVTCTCIGKHRRGKEMESNDCEAFGCEILTRRETSSSNDCEYKWACARRVGQRCAPPASGKRPRNKVERALVKKRLGVADGRVWACHKPNEAVDISCQQGNMQADGGSVMVWSLFTWHGLDPLVNAPTKLNCICCKTLIGNHLQSFMYFSFPDNVGMFQQENVPSHQAVDIQDWFWRVTAKGWRETLASKIMKLEIPGSFGQLVRQNGLTSLQRSSVHLWSPCHIELRHFIGLEGCLHETTQEAANEKWKKGKGFLGAVLLGERGRSARPMVKAALYKHSPNECVSSGGARRRGRGEERLKESEWDDWSRRTRAAPRTARQQSTCVRRTQIGIRSKPTKILDTRQNPGANLVRFPAGSPPDVRIVPDDAVGRRNFSRFSLLPHPFIPAQLHTHLNHPHRLSRPRANVPPHFLHAFSRDFPLNSSGCVKGCLLTSDDIRTGKEDPTRYTDKAKYKNLGCICERAASLLVLGTTLSPADGTPSVKEMGGGGCRWEPSPTVSTEQRRNERVGETVILRENPPTSGNVRHDSHLQKYGSDPAGDRMSTAFQLKDHNLLPNLSPLLHHEESTLLLLLTSRANPSPDTKEATTLLIPIPSHFLSLYIRAHHAPYTEDATFALPKCLLCLYCSNKQLANHSTPPGKGGERRGEEERVANRSIPPVERLGDCCMGIPKGGRCKEAEDTTKPEFFTWCLCRSCTLHHRNPLHTLLLDITMQAYL
ncbi:hypothetical protein PR048_005252 [Dryococelus australis]|uniref:Uncharacterized protein n=1 Tax=Dryococelus australis TaxID=614101 RepID=A0ABQ9I8L1_9NEOP|nr:hypothetical protein PR048_005252 [Dryococelus australis]